MSIALLAAAGLAIGVLGYRYLHADNAQPDLAAMPAPPAITPPAAASPSALPAEPTPVHEPAPSATAADFHEAPPAPLDAPVEATKAAPPSSAAPAPSAAGVASDAAAEPPASGTQRVTITTVPPKAKFFHYGKQVGTAPFVVDLPAGERRAYEVWLPGHIARKLVIDGSKPEISLGLREETH
jgi:hypothetical protein